MYHLLIAPLYVNKSEKNFSSITMYNDYVVSETQFHCKHPMQAVLYKTNKPKS